MRQRYHAVCSSDAMIATRFQRLAPTASQALSFPNFKGFYTRFLSSDQAGGENVTILQDGASSVQDFVADNNRSILYYTAVWCGPCRAVKPWYKKLADENSGTVAFGQIDIDENPEAAEEANIRVVPTFATYQDGKKSGEFSGFDPEKLAAAVADLKKNA